MNFSSIVSDLSFYLVVSSRYLILRVGNTEDDVPVALSVGSVFLPRVSHLSSLGGGLPPLVQRSWGLWEQPLGLGCVKPEPGLLVCRSTEQHPGSFQKGFACVRRCCMPSGFPGAGTRYSAHSHWPINISATSCPG